MRVTGPKVTTDINNWMTKLQEAMDRGDWVFPFDPHDKGAAVVTDLQRRFCPEGEGCIYSDPNRMMGGLASVWFDKGRISQAEMGEALHREGPVTQQFILLGRPDDSRYLAAEQTLRRMWRLIQLERSARVMLGKLAPEFDPETREQAARYMAAIKMLTELGGDTDDDVSPLQ